MNIPLGFLGAILGALCVREPHAEAKFDELLVRANTGLGAGKATPHEAKDFSKNVVAFVGVSLILLPMKSQRKRKNQSVASLRTDGRTNPIFF